MADHGTADSSELPSLIKSADVREQDVVAAKVHENGDGTATVQVVHYPSDGKRRRERVVNIPGITNKADAERVVSELKRRIRGDYIPPHRPRSSRTRPRWLVLINPFSGQQLARRLWTGTIRRVLESADTDFEVCETERPGHATELATQLRLDHYDGVLVCSGDGLVNEFLTGLVLRKDRARALRLPLCHVTGGTSNALAAAVCFACNEPFSPRSGFGVEAALLSVSSRRRNISLRLYSVDTEHDGRRLAFLSVAYGLIADVDIGSERFRWAGMVRLHIEAFIRVARLPSAARYRCRISYLPVDDEKQSEVIDKSKVRHCDAHRVLGADHFTYDSVHANGELDNDKLPQGVFASLDEALDEEDATLVKIPPLYEPVHKRDGWRVIEGEYVFVTCSTISHLGSDLPYLPSCKLDEPVVYITLCDWRRVKSRLQVAAMMIGIDESNHLDYSCFEVIPCRAVRVEPAADAALSGGAFLTVDGEPLERGSAFQIAPTALHATLAARRYNRHSSK